MSGGLQLLLLGAVEARRAGSTVVLAGAKLQAVVALLALGSPHAVAGDRLIDELWGSELPSNPVNALQAQVSQLRRVLGSDSVARQGSGYRLLIEPEAVDALRLERLVRQARTTVAAGDLDGALAMLEAGISMVRGPALAGLHDFEFARRAAVRLDELAISAHEELLDVRLALGGHADVVDGIEALIEVHPMRERLHAQRVVALYRCARQADALRAYQSARSMLIEELGVEPGPALRDLERAVLAHDPALDAPVVAAARDVGPIRPARAAGPRRRDVAPRGGAPLIGRSTELEMLLDDLSESDAGRGQVVLVAGEPGIGKSRMIEEVSSEAARRGATVTWGRCRAGRGVPGLWPWVQALNGLVEKVDADEVRDAVKHGAGQIGSLLPAVAALVGPVSDSSPTDPESARFQLLDAAATLVRRLSRNRSIVIALDDLQWADEASLDLLHIVGSDLSDLNLMVMGSYRTVDPPVDERIAEVIADLIRHRWVRHLVLEGLDARALSDLIAVSGPRPSVDAVDELQNRTRGNPFFVIETLRLLEGSGGRVDAESIRRGVPKSVRGVIRRRIARVPPDTVTALTAASVLGYDFEVGLAAAVADMDVRTMLSTLEPAVHGQLLVESADGIGRFRFMHGLVQETLYADMGPAQRAELHERAGEALEVRHGDSAGAHLLVLADHWARAVPAASPTKAIDYARRAATWSLGTIDHQLAELQLRNALSLVALLPASSERNRLELDVLSQQAVLAGSALTSYTPDELATATARVRELCAVEGDMGRLIAAMWQRGASHLMRAELDAGAKVGDELLDLAERTGEARALVLGHLCTGLMQLHRGGLDRACHHLERSIELCDAGQAAQLRGLVEDPVVLTRAFAAIAHWLVGCDAEADEDLKRSFAAAAAEGSGEYAATNARWAASTVAVLRRDVANAKTRCAEGAALATSIGHPVGAHLQSLLGGWADVAAGDTEAGLSAIVDHTDAVRAVRPNYLMPWFLALHADACVTAARFDEALRSIDRALSVVATTGESWCRPELLRLRAIARGADVGADSRVITDLDEARRLAHEQGAVAWIRRLDATSVADLQRAGTVRSHADDAADV
jgi:DNA-binding SARP family transcriptional activator